MKIKFDRSLRDIVESYDKTLYKLVSSLAETCVEIASSIAGKSSKVDTHNIFGETQLEVDVWSNDLLIHRLEKSGLVREAASEELKDIVKWSKGEYSVVLDPLDGSSNLQSNNLLGTIIGVYRNTELPARGRDLFASMYFLYGPYLELVLSLNGQVHIFHGTGQDEGSTRLLSSIEPHKIPTTPSVYGIGGARAKWTGPVRGFVETLEARPLSLRYGGSFVGDYNQVLMKGGFFAYPELSDAPNGKYRLQFESNPIAFITENAGGAASNGTMRILDVQPESISQRCATYVGTSSLVMEFETVYKKHRRC
jgi:fructose-1,6-bisphosphatase I